MSTLDQPLVTILMAKGRESKMCMATMVPMKGGSIEFPARRVLAHLKEIGLESSDVVFKSDQENAIGDLLNNIAKRRSALSQMEKADERSSGADPADRPRTVHEAAPVGSSQSNGFIERAIQEEEGQIRTLKSELESRILVRNAPRTARNEECKPARRGGATRDNGAATAGAPNGGAVENK